MLKSKIIWLVFTDESEIRRNFSKRKEKDISSEEDGKDDDNLEENIQKQFFQIIIILLSITG